MRIRTNGERNHREDTIERAADHYDCNKTRALMLAADQVPGLHAAVSDVLARDDLTLQQKREIAQRFNRCRGMAVDVSEDVEVAVED